MKRKCDAKCSSRRKTPAAAVYSQPEPHHYLSIYRNQPINFWELAAVDTSFREAWNKLRSRQNQHRSATSTNSSNSCYGKQSFSTHVDREFTIAVTRALLRRDFHLDLPSVPFGYLCPPLPNRLNYVCWLRELLDTGMAYDEDHDDDDDDTTKKRLLSTQSLHYQGIDIGTGATCIYPLLLSTRVFSGTENSTLWKFLATDVDPISVESAIQNVQANNLQERIRVVCVPKSVNSAADIILQPVSEGQKNDHVASLQGPILTALNAANESDMFRSVEKGENSPPTTIGLVPSECSANCTSHKCFDFVMTNPPFYSSCEEAEGYRIGDGRERTEMTKSEAVYEGGEYAFILDMIHDSIVLRTRITWYTSMIGKKKTLKEVENKLRSMGFGRANIRTTEFIQGKTRRWGIAWTFQEFPERLIALKTKPIQDIEFRIDKHHMNSPNAEEEVLSRISQFCQTKDRNLICYRKVSSSCGSYVVTIKSDKSTGVPAIAPNLQRAANDFSQNDSFLIDIIFQTTDPSHDNDDFFLLSAKCKAYSHSPKGNLSVQRTLDELCRYVCQTSRYWRRLHAKTK